MSSDMDGIIHILPLRVRWYLAELTLYSKINDEPIIPADFPPVERLNVTLRREGRLRASMSGAGPTLDYQLLAATRAAIADRRYGGEITISEVTDLDIEVWIQMGSIYASLEERKQIGFFYMGVDGVEVRFNAKTAYFKPSVALTSPVKDQTALLSKVCRKAGLSDAEWLNPEVEIYKTSWQSVVLPAISGTSTRISRLRKMATVRLNESFIRDLKRQSVLYLIRNQKASGEITYLVNAITGLAISETTNAVRMSGCFYALSSVLATLEDLEVISPCERALVLLYRNILTRSRLWKEGSKAIYDSNSVNAGASLGTTALFVCGLSMPPFSSLVKEEYGFHLQALKAAQDDYGRFITDLRNNLRLERSENYFSGQALLALSLAAENGDDEAMELCSGAFSAYRDHFISRPTSAFTGWHIDVWSRLAVMTGRDEYCSFAFRQADWLLDMLIRDSLHQDWIGGFTRDSVEPSASSIVFAEALCCAILLAEKCGDRERIERYGEALRLSIQFCLRLAVDRIPQSFRVDPKRSDGGITISNCNLTVRCDFVQHFITFCQKVIPILHLVHERP
jgi:hypothetical protein